MRGVTYPVMSCIIRTHISSDLDKFVTNGLLPCCKRGRLTSKIIIRQAVQKLFIILSLDLESWGELVLESFKQFKRE